MPPYLMIGEHMRYGVDPETGGRLPALKGFADERLRVLCPDETFARRIVTPEVAAPASRVAAALKTG